MAVIVPLLALFVLRRPTLSPVAATVSTVESRAVTPALFGIGPVEVRYIYRIGLTFARRLQRLNVDVGEQIKVEQVLGEMDPVDLDNRVHEQEPAFMRTEAVLR